MKVSRSGYYDWLDRPLSTRAIKHKKILALIRETHRKHPMWGVDPIWAEVKESIPCSRGTVHKLMKEHGIKSKRKGKWKATTNSNHNLPVAPNLLNQEFDVSTPNAVWVGDYPDEKVIPTYNRYARKSNQYKQNYRNNFLSFALIRIAS